MFVWTDMQHLLVQTIKSTLNNNKKTLSSCFDIVKNTIIQNLLEILWYNPVDMSHTPNYQNDF